MLKLLFIVIIIVADNVYGQQIIDKQPRQAGEVSQRKCREYASHVQEKDECGHRIVKRIVGGELAGRTEFPHMAIIGYESKDGDMKWICGGSVISEEYILTAALCLSSKSADPKVVLLGVTNLNDTNHRQEIKIAKKIIHPEYKEQFYHDIALLKLETPIEMNSYVRPACLYPNSQIKVAKAIATGWGTTGFAEQRPIDLHKVTLDIVDHESCNKIYKEVPNGIKDEIHVCTGNGSEAKDTCTGDSGGPLQTYHAEDDNMCIYDIIGVTSFGKFPCSGDPSVSTRVSYYIKWIEDIVWPENFE